MAPTKDRQNAHVSVREHERARDCLNEAIRAVYLNKGPSPILVELRAAMGYLGMQEAAWSDGRDEPRDMAERTYAERVEEYQTGQRIGAEQQARDMLERMGIENAQSFTAGDVVELANLINDYQGARHGHR